MTNGGRWGMNKIYKTIIHTYRRFRILYTRLINHRDELAGQILCTNHEYMPREALAEAAFFRMDVCADLLSMVRMMVGLRLVAGGTPHRAHAIGIVRWWRVNIGGAVPGGGGVCNTMQQMREITSNQTRVSERLVKPQ